MDSSNHNEYLESKIKELAKENGIHFSNRGILDGGKHGVAKFICFEDFERAVKAVVQDCINEMKIGRFSEPNEPWQEARNEGVDHCIGALQREWALTKESAA